MLYWCRERSAEARARDRRRPQVPEALPLRTGIENARREARRLLEWFGVESAADIHVEGFAKQLGIDIVDAKLEGAMAQLVVGIGHVSIYLADSLTDMFARRWAVAHELGHFVLDHPSPPLEALSGPRPRNLNSEVPDEEAEADCFALELLIPECVVCAIPDEDPMTLTAPLHLARTCGVSLEAGAIRVAELSKHRCAAVLSDRSEIRWAAPSRSFLDAFDILPISGGRLHPQSLAMRYFDQAPASRLPALVPAAAWLGVQAESRLLEHSVPGSQPGTVLTMLWSSSRDARPRPPDTPVTGSEWSAGRATHGADSSSFAGSRIATINWRRPSLVSPVKSRCA